MIYDCFMFFNELDVLDIRLHTLNEVVDRFIIIESPRTHTGESKPLYFNENRDRFRPFLHKITHLIFTDYPEPPVDTPLQQKYWYVENAQRNALIRGLSDAQPSDTIILSDLDEIPSPDAVQKAAKLPGITRCSLRLYYYFLNFRDYTTPFWNQGTQICSYSELITGNQFKNFVYNDFVPRGANPGITMTMLRFVKPTRTLKNSGWHFSYIGGIKKVIKKLSSIADGVIPKNLSDEQIAERILQGKDITTGRTRFFAEKISQPVFPSYILENLGSLKNLIFPITATYLKRTAHKRFFTSVRRTILSILIVIGRYSCPRPLKTILWNLIFKR